MSERRAEGHPYRQWEGTARWAVLDRALAELVENRDLVESTRHEYVVGYLCQALSDAAAEGAPDRVGEDRAAKSRAELRRAQDLLRPYRQAGRSLTDELIAERRAEAAHE